MWLGARQAVPLPVYGDCRQSRCFCHVHDAVRAVVKLLDLPDQTAGEIYNVDSSQEVTIVQLAQTVIERTDSQSAIQYIPYSEAYAPGFEDMRRRVPDTTKIQQAVGWQPKHDLNQILADVIEWERVRL